MRMVVCLAAGTLLALSLSSCTPGPYVRDPACRAAYDNCIRACEVGPPVPSLGTHLGQAEMPNFEHGCGNACYTDARACEGRARAKQDR